jgi:hypothetical protein
LGTVQNGADPGKRPLRVRIIVGGEPARLQIVGASSDRRFRSGSVFVAEIYPGTIDGSDIALSVQHGKVAVERMDDGSESFLSRQDR